MFFYDQNDRIVKVFVDEFYQFQRKNLWTKSFQTFISEKDLGIVFVRVGDPETEGIFDIYEVVDEKKWFLNKIKYGI